MYLYVLTPQSMVISGVVLELRMEFPEPATYTICT